MTRPGSGVNDKIKSIAGEKAVNAFAITDVQVTMGKVAADLLQSPPVPNCVSLGTKEISPHVVIHTDHVKTQRVEEGHSFRANQTAASGYQNLHNALPL
jgi:hypothetical protein